MDLDAYYRSLADELNAMKDRVRSFIADSHWQTDGEWKESVLKAVLRRHLPANVAVGRGFIMCNFGEGIVRPSKQIDVLLYDTTKPVLFRDGDLVFIPPISVRGIIEVKTKIKDSTNSFSSAVKNLAYNLQLIKEATRLNGVNTNIFVGLFAYEFTNGNISEGRRANFETNAHRVRQMENVLRTLKKATEQPYCPIINHISLGSNYFVKFWDKNPDNPFHNNYNSWHAYSVRQKAQAYFINNVVATLSPEQLEENQDLWFPYYNRKENHLVTRLTLQ